MGGGCGSSEWLAIPVLTPVGDWEGSERWSSQTLSTSGGHSRAATLRVSSASGGVGLGFPALPIHESSEREPPGRGPPQPAIAVSGAAATGTYTHLGAEGTGAQYTPLPAGLRKGGVTAPLYRNDVAGESAESFPGMGGAAERQLRPEPECGELAVEHVPPGEWQEPGSSPRTDALGETRSSHPPSKGRGRREKFTGEGGVLAERGGSFPQRASSRGTRALRT